MISAANNSIGHSFKAMLKETVLSACVAAYRTFHTDADSSRARSVITHKFPSLSRESLAGLHAPQGA